LAGIVQTCAALSIHHLSKSSRPFGHDKKKLTSILRCRIVHHALLMTVMTERGLTAPVEGCPKLEHMATLNAKSLHFLDVRGIGIFI
jgi:hypothetical protein